MFKKLTVSLALSIFCVLPASAAIDYSGNIKAAQAAYPTLKQLFCKDSPSANNCGIRSIRVIDDWAWFTWDDGHAAGAAVYKRQGSTWRSVTGGGGVMTIQDAINSGVPKAIAEFIVPTFYILSPPGDELVELELLEHMSAWELLVVRNAIFAKHGMKFQTKRLQDYFNTWPWYQPDPNFSPDMLTDIDRKNIEIILKLEKQKKEQ